MPGIFPGHIVTEQGQNAAGLYLPVFLIAVGVFVLVEGLVIIITLRYRRKKTDTELPPQTHGNNVLEVVWTIIPAVIVLGLFVLSMSVLVKNDATATDPAPKLTVDATAFQWQWTFDYQEQGLSYTGAGANGPEMVLPVGETVIIRLHAQDVIHAFYVPQFYFKMDAIPGRTNQFPVTIEEPGTYGGQCAEFCGLSHAQMYFTVRAVSPADFDAWVASEQVKARATPVPAPSGAAATSNTIAVKAISATEGFDPKTLTAAAGVPITVDFTNADPAVVHNFSIKGANPDGSDFIGMPIDKPGQQAQYQAPALAAGTYTFYCSVHPTMTGTLTVQ